MTIKSRPVRSRFVKQLRDNLRRLMSRINTDIVVRSTWDYIEVNSSDDEAALQRQLEEVLRHTPGVCFFVRVRQFPLGDMESILMHTLQFYADKLSGLTFAVRCKRAGKHVFKSIDVERYVGGGLNQRTEAAGVNLTNPDITVNLEIRDQDLFIKEENQKGLDGFPLGTQDGVLSLISGGFDSSISSYMSIKRGLKTHYCFFNLGGHEHEIAVKEVALYLWMKYGASHKVKFVTVPFEAVVAEIMEKVDNSQMGVILKRMMLRAASEVAEDLSLQALVTGESVAQVSSQTLPNLAVIDEVTDTLVFRPLIMSDKQDIVDTARAIGTEEFSAAIPEYCGVISIKPTTRARMHRIEREEAQFDFSVLEAAIADKEVRSIDNLQLDKARESAPVKLVATPEKSAVIVDIRHPDEEERKPLDLSTANEIKKAPFYKLNTYFSGSAVSPDVQYLLYCEKGMMSELHAAYLMDQGHQNVGVYRPE
jgi:tRNA uracil 4-sulfurtransferase